DAERPAEARRSFRSAAELFASEGDLAAFATSSLLEIEALARAGRFREARTRLEEVRARTGVVAELTAFEDALRESRSGLESLRALREEAARGVLRMIRSGASKK
ncbi:MAG: hypothetical protein JNK60_03385, partial [Acidobacteria bacterium]|nr:hypothetical protein [Acidobacteriota bacterium]